MLEYLLQEERVITEFSNALLEKRVFLQRCLPGNGIHLFSPVPQSCFSYFYRLVLLQAMAIAVGVTDELKE